MLRSVIGICGYKQHGKSTIAKILVEEYGYTLTSFAEPLKQFAYAVNPIVYTDTRGFCHYRDVIDDIGIDRAKEEVPEVRRLLQYIGTEGGRNVLGEDIWVDTWAKSIQNLERVVVADVRFPNEAAKIKAVGGQLWRVTRRGIGEPDISHVSEQHVAGFEVDYDLVNHEISELKEVVRMIMAAYPDILER